MASTINASTTAGIVLTPDTSGEISFQSAGVTKAGVNGTGLTGDGSQLTGLGGGLPVGTIIDFAGTSPPTGFLTCPITLTTISRTTYADLFTAIGTTWGVGDGSTTFGLPWFAANYASVQANANVGTATIGENLAHTHTTNIWWAAALGLTYGEAAGVSGFIDQGSSSSGGSANLAAGVRVLKCIKF